MPYDPQRSRTRPEVAESEPAPVEAILQGVAAPQPAEPEEGPKAATPGEPGVAKPAVEVSASERTGSGAQVGARAIPKAAIAAVASLVGLTALWLVLRRRRKR